MSVPVLVAIAGGTSSGKTTLTQALAQQIADLRPVVLSQDAYFRDFSDVPEAEREAARTANRPEAVNWAALRPQLEALKRGEAVSHPVPGTRAGTRGDPPAQVGPSAVVIIEGHLLLVDERVRELADLKVFVDCDVEVRVLRRIARDTGRPSGSLERSLAWYWRDVLPNNQRYTTLQRTYADLIIPYDRPNPLAARLLATCIRELASSQPSAIGTPCDPSARM
ncbi:MAG: uridine kinase family protein [Chloroflexota bacterium]